ncbi:DUF397 domain-containing protein [Streptomyces sp. I05A-00742]|uniref:DUF397 domain-containing protein n=1 Tax=Streptomyces sp. I05A-00742 TaxID=2732853 RepID=UPI001487E9B9|nr:DUF397 domain-containing protein [Streptomyces sp. I05A-00742]
MSSQKREWFKSSYSQGGGMECVEVTAAPGTVHVRDSKRRSGPRLSIPSGAWAEFVTYASRG